MIDFPLKQINGVAANKLSAQVDGSGQLIIRRRFTQSVSGSAPMKVAGQCIAIHTAYPKADVVIDMAHAVISPAQRDSVKTQINYMNRGILRKFKVIFDDEIYPMPPVHTSSSLASLLS